MIDQIDKIIIRQLQENARKSLSELSKACNISSTAIHQRIKKLEEQGVITGSSITVNAQKLGYRSMAYMGIYLKKASYNCDVVEDLAKVEEIIECSFTTGAYSLLIKIVCRDNAHLMELLSKKIQSIEGIARTETFICLDQSIERVIPVV